MQVWILILYMSIGYGPASSTGGPIIIEDISTKEKCEKIAYGLKSRLDSKYDWHFCEQVEK